LQQSQNADKAVAMPSNILACKFTQQRKIVRNVFHIEVNIEINEPPNRAAHFVLQIALRKQTHHPIPPFIAGEIRNQLCIDVSVRALLMG